MEQTILRSEAKKIIESGVLFDLAFVAADRRRGTGGEYIDVKNWQKMMSAPAEENQPGKPESQKLQALKDPNHWLHKTFNIHNPTNRSVHPIKVHYRLMHRINGKTIIQ